MTGVGALKATGFLRHDLSRCAGVLELIGGLVLLPRWRVVSDVLGKNPDLSLRLGAWIVLAGLGIILSTNKRKSPVCWSQILFAFDVMRAQEGEAALKTCVVAVAMGLLVGFALIFVGIDLKVHREEGMWEPMNVPFYVLLFAVLVAIAAAVGIKAGQQAYELSPSPLDPKHNKVTGNGAKAS